MGSRGPVPKRHAERLGHRAKGEKKPEQATVLARRVPAPPADPDWHPYAAAWFNSLASSGQSVFYEPSDWTTAYILAEQVSRELKPKVVGIDQKFGRAIIEEAPISGPSLNAFLKGITSLLGTEGDRRRAQLELSRQGEDAQEEARVLQLVQDEESAAFG
jgi:hypothetical protein